MESMSDHGDNCKRKNDEAVFRFCNSGDIFQQGIKKGKVFKKTAMKKRMKKLSGCLLTLVMIFAIFSAPSLAKDETESVTGDVMLAAGAPFLEGETVTGAFPKEDDKDIATIRYYLNSEKTDYGFADFSYNTSTDRYEYSFPAPYSGFTIAEGTSLSPDENATIIAEYYSLLKWDGAVDTTWYETDTEFSLEYPAQLAGLAAIVRKH